MGYNMLGTSKKCDSNGKDENSSGSFTPLNTLEFIGIGYPMIPPNGCPLQGVWLIIAQRIPGNVGDSWAKLCQQLLDFLGYPPLCPPIWQNLTT